MKRAELSIKKFNEVAIPHHLGLLKNHKSNIEKSLALGDWDKIKKEEINAMRVVKQLRNLLLEMDVLRGKINDNEVNKFDSMIKPGRVKAMEAIQEYMDMQFMTSASKKSHNTYIEDDETVTEVEGNLPQIQADFQNQQHQLQARQACLEQFESLHREVEDLHSMFSKFGELAHEQGEQVNIIADNAEEALENVNEGEVQLRTALKYQKAMYPVVGALLGTAVGGPIGLLVGLKAGGLAAISCGILGFTGGSILKKTEVENGIKEEKKEE